MPYSQERFRKRLKALRVRAGLNQQELADAVGDNQSGISALENGIPPKLEDVCNLAAYLGVTVEYLAGLVDHQTPLPPGAWLIDDDALEACLAGAPPDPGELWAVAVPERHRIVSSPEYAKLAAKVAAVVSQTTPRKKPRKK